MSLSPYNLTIPDQSPTFMFAPYGDGSMNGGWNVTYSDSSDSDWAFLTGSSIGNGLSKHRTTFAGASATISWTGTAVYLIGQASASAYTTSLDDAVATVGSPNVEEDLLVAYTGLNYGDHTLTLDVVGSSEVDISAAIITVGIGEKGSSVQNTTFDAVEPTAGSESINDQTFQTDGSWIIVSVDVGNSAVQPNIQSKAAGGTVTFELSNSSAFIVHGNLYADHSAYTVNVTGPSGPLSNQLQQFNGSSRYEAKDSILYFKTGLDAAQIYTVTFENAGTGNTQIFDMIDVVSMNGFGSNTQGSSLVSSRPCINKSSVLGIVIGILLALLIGCGANFLYLRRRRRYRGTRPTKTFLVDEEKMADISVHEDVKCDQSHVVNPFTPHFPPTVVSYTAFLSDSLPASHL